MFLIYTKYGINNTKYIISYKIWVVAVLICGVSSLFLEQAVDSKRKGKSVGFTLFIDLSFSCHIYFVICAEIWREGIW